MFVARIFSHHHVCSDHGYVLAEMSVHHTRAYFKSKYGGHLVDNPKVRPPPGGYLLALCPHQATDTSLRR